MSEYYQKNKDKWKKYYMNKVIKLNNFCKICNKQLTAKDGTGRCQIHFSKETRENMRMSATGRPMSDVAKEKCRITKLGEKNPMWGKMGPESSSWKGGSKDYPNFYYQTDWEKLRLIIYRRDNWLCQSCGVHCARKSNSWKRIQCHHKV